MEPGIYFVRCDLVKKPGMYGGCNWECRNCGCVVGDGGYPPNEKCWHCDAKQYTTTEYNNVGIHVWKDFYFGYSDYEIIKYPKWKSCTKPNYSDNGHYIGSWYCNGG